MDDKLENRKGIDHLFVKIEISDIIKNYDHERS